MDDAPRDMLANLDVVQLAQRCAAEQQLYHQHQPSDDRYCLELFHRALQQHDEYAWSLLYEQFSGTLLAWVHQHRCARLALEREEPHTLTHAAWTKLWAATTSTKEKKPDFSSLASILSYLKRCVNSVVLDEVRKQRARQLEVPLPDVNLPRSDDPGDGPAARLWELIERALPDRRERLLAYWLFVQGLKPREVVRLAPQSFPTAQEVYRLARNIQDRLRRNPLLLRWLEENRE